MKKLEIEKIKPTFIISVLKVEYLVALVSLIFDFFINKIALANKWMRKIIPSRSNSAWTEQENPSLFADEVYGALKSRIIICSWFSFWLCNKNSVHCIACHNFITFIVRKISHKCPPARLHSALKWPFLRFYTTNLKN